MPKYCSVPNCKNDSANGQARKSFYKFPLQDPVRLQQWLRNMGRENWTPSRHQYICHDHFAPSCFKVRWGIRYLESDAVPTVFQEAEKRRAADPGGTKLKRPRGNKNQAAAESGDAAATEIQTLRMYEIAELLQPADDGQQGVRLPLTLYQADGVTEVVVMSDASAGDGQQDVVSELTAAILRQGGKMLISCTDDPPDANQTQVIAYLESDAPSLGFSSDTVLSSALSAEPISSTLPIVSKHAAAPPPASLVLTLERLDGEESLSEVEDAEQPGHQLVEHCYHRNSLSKEQLEAIVAELQKKVKVLQQRHRRHLEKLIGLENTVSQLRQSNLLNEERLQLLENVYVQSNAEAPHAGETVTIVYEEDEAAYLCAPPAESPP